MRPLTYGHNIHECQYIYERCIIKEPIIEDWFVLIPEERGKYRITDEKNYSYINVIYRHIKGQLYGGFIMCCDDNWVIIAVEKELRGLGVASMLVDRLIADMDKIKTKELQWCCHKRNLPSFRLALSKGFVIVDQDERVFHLKYFKK